MAALDIPAPDDPRINVQIAVPLRGGKMLELALPRFDYIDEPVLAAMDVEIEKIRADETLNERQKARARVLAMLKPVTPARAYKQCEELPLGPLAKVSEVWSDQSNIELGEFLASAQSSTGNTEAPSNTTSTAAAITGATSAEGSRGPSSTT